MKRRVWILILALVLLCSGCGANTNTTASSSSAQGDQGGLTVVATTYPVYLLARSVAEGVEGV